MPPLFDSDSLLANLPDTQALVRAGVIAVGLASAASLGAGCEQNNPAPTCGICCHVPDDPSCQDAGTVEADAGAPDAGLGPTCGPCCHGGTGCPDGGL